MKPTPQQEIQLQTYLTGNLRYRETYAEFYDHILSALETSPDDASFDKACQEMIANELGGIEGMRLIEQNYKRSVFAEMQKKYFSYAIESFKFPWIIMLPVFAVLFYGVFKQPWFTVWEYMILLLLIRYLPFVLLARHLRMVFQFSSRHRFVLRPSKQTNGQHLTGATKGSVKKGFFRWLNRSPIVLVGFLLVGAHSSQNTEATVTLTAALMALCCVLITWHSFNLYRVYSDEIQVNINI